MGKKLLLFFAVSLLFASCNSHKSKITELHEEKLQLLKNEIRENLTENLLPYWSEKMVDTVNGGFYGRVD